MAMRAFAFAGLLVCVGAAVVERADSDMNLGANPIRKIVTLLQDMQKEIEAEGAHESELFDKFMCFCTGGADGLAKTSSDAAQEIETMTSRHSEDTAVKSGLEGDLVRHQADRVAATQDLEKAEALRGKENAEYVEQLADQQTSFNALSGAIPALEKGLGGASLLQGGGVGQLKKVVESSQTISSEEKRSVISFLEGKQSESDPGTSQIVGILKNMGDEMSATIKDIQTTEDQAVQGFNEIKAAKQQEIEMASEAIEAKTKRAGELAVSIVNAADGVEDATVEKADADKFLATLDTQCVEKKAEHAARSEARSEEVSALSQAVSILNDDDALDVFKKSVPSALLQMQQKQFPGRRFGFLQAASASPDQLRRAQGIIASAGEFHRSQKLEFLSYTINTKLRAAQKGAVDFSQVTKTIDEMLGVLAAEQADDAKHRTWCQGELGSSADEKSNTESKIASLSANMAQATDESTQLAEDVAALNAGVASLDKDVATATEQRKQEHQAYLETVQLGEAAIQLMGKAKNRLQKFYNPALYVAPKKVELSDEDAIVARMGASFVQVAKHSSSRVEPPVAPETASGPYQSKGQKSGGVMALMDMLVKELVASQSDASHDEKTAQGEYVALMGDSQATRASDLKSVMDKTAARAEVEGKLVAMKENHQLTTESLANTASYIQELHGSCDFIMENFQLRADARTNEVESLKNAKAVLAGASFN